MFAANILENAEVYNGAFIIDTVRRSYVIIMQTKNPLVML